LPGEEVQEGDTITLVYNPSNAPMAVPDLAGLTIEQARTALLNLGLTIGIITPQNDPTAPADTIIASVPKPVNRFWVEQLLIFLLVKGAVLSKFLTFKVKRRKQRVRFLRASLLNS